MTRFQWIIGLFFCLSVSTGQAQIRLVKELRPRQAVGYVVMNETASARAAGMHRLLRAFFVWVMVIAIPAQGMAASQPGGHRRLALDGASTGHPLTPS